MTPAQREEFERLERPAPPPRAGWDAFLDGNARQLRDIARSIYRRWVTPEGVQVDDVEQEVLLAAWRAFEAWRSDGGMTLRAYVFCSARHAAKYWVHKQRSSLGYRGDAPSRAPLAFSSFGCDADGGYELAGESSRAAEMRPPGPWESLPGQEAVAEFALAVRRALGACGSPVERDAIELLIEHGFDVDAATRARRLPRSEVLSAFRKVTQ